MRLPPAKPSLVILLLILLFKVPDQMPAFKDYKVLDWHSIPKVLDFTPRRVSADPVDEEELRLHPDRDPSNYKIYRIDSPEGSLTRFYEALRRTELKEPGAVTRIVHYGDSPTTADLITGDVRTLLQKHFGDGGHGYCLIAKPWEWYGHDGVSMQSGGWEVEVPTQTRASDGFYGLGGASFRGAPGSWAQFTARHAGHTSVEISFQYQPGGGNVLLYANDQPVGQAETGAAPAGPGWTTLEVPAAARRFRLSVYGGPVRVYGVRFSKPGPGVEFDSLGLNGAYISVLGRMFNEAHWAAQLRHLHPDLVIINYGTNESAYATYVDKYYARELRNVVRRVRAAVPQASLLLMSPMDRGVRQTGGEIGTVPGIPRLVAIQQQVAGEADAAFFNTFQAMGGPGTMGRWYEAEPRLVGGDFIHPMPKGAKIVGNLLYQALFDGYNRFKVSRMRKQYAEVSRK